MYNQIEYPNENQLYELLFPFYDAQRVEMGN